MSTIAILGTLDSKGEEHAFIAELVKARGHVPLLIDVGSTWTKGVAVALPDLPAEPALAAGWEGSIDRGIEHVGYAQTGLWIQCHAPVIFKQSPRVAIADVAISRKFMRETAHVARALDVVLAT